MKIENPVTLMWLTAVPLLLVVAGTAMPILGCQPPLWKYVYSAGAVLLLIVRIITPYRGDNLRVKRLSRLESWSAIFFCVAAFFMFYKGAGPTDWLAFTLAGGAVQCYTSIMIPRAQKGKR